MFQSLNLLAMTETHIHPNDNDNLPISSTPVGFKLYAHGFGGEVGLLSIIISSSKLLLPLVHLLDHL